MTPEERATAVAVRLLADYRERGGDGSRILSEQGIAHLIATAIWEAVAAEREACAQEAEGFRDYDHRGSPDIAEAIRARGSATTPRRPAGPAGPPG